MSTCDHREEYSLFEGVIVYRLHIRVSITALPLLSS
jgi:hypothetical protein